MFEHIITNAKKKMNIVIEKLEEGFAKVRTGRASTDLIEGILVEYYGNPTPLKQVASLSVPQANLIVIQPWDKTVIQAIEKAIQEADLGFSPINDGQVVRITLPQMTSQDKEKFVKLIHEKSEAARIALRNLRKDAREEIEKLEKNGKLTEDDQSRSDERLNKLIDEFNTKVEDLSEKKEQELKTI